MKLEQLAPLFAGLGKFLEFLFDSDRKKEARLRVAVDAAERYILVNEGSEPYAGLSDEKKEKYLRHFKKRLLAYN